MSDGSAPPRSRSRGRWLGFTAVGAVVVLSGVLLLGVGHLDNEHLGDQRWTSSRSPQARVTPVTKGPPATVSPVVSKPVTLYRHFSGDRPLRLLVVGDSVGVTFARGLQLWADAYGHAEVLDEAHMWCALGRKLPISHGLGIQLPGTGCDDWGTRWKHDIEQFDPDVVFVYFSVWEVAPRILPGHKDLLQPGAAALDAWQLSEYRAAADVLSARGAQVVWFTIPCENEPIAKGTPFWYVNRRTVPALAASRPAVHVIDLDHELCVRGPSHDFAGVHDARPDGAHFSDAGAFAVANWAMPIVLGEAPNPKTVDETVPPAR